MWSLDAFVSESFQKNMSEVCLIFRILKACEFFLILIVSPFKERYPCDFFNAELPVSIKIRLWGRTGWVTIPVPTVSVDVLLSRELALVRTRLPVQET